MARDPNAALDRCIALERECTRRQQETSDKLRDDYHGRMLRIRSRVPEDLRASFDRALLALDTGRPEPIVLSEADATGKAPPKRVYVLVGEVFDGLELYSAHASRDEADHVRHCNFEYERIEDRPAIVRYDLHTPKPKAKRGKR